LWSLCTARESLAAIAALARVPLLLPSMELAEEPDRR